MKNHVCEIIIHHSGTLDSETLSWGKIREYHLSKGWKDIGYHYGVELVRDDIEVLIGRMSFEEGAHCRGHNNSSIGICLVGDFDRIIPPLEIWEKGLWLVRGLLVKHNLRKTVVFGHGELDDRSCPGKYFDMDRFRAEL